MPFHGEARGEGNMTTAAVRLSEEEKHVKVSQGLPANWRERHREIDRRPDIDTHDSDLPALEAPRSGQHCVWRSFLATKGI